MNVQILQYRYEMSIFQVNCGDPLIPPHAVLSFTDTLRDDSVHITCEEEYIMSSKVSSLELVCLPNGIWTEPTDICIGTRSTF